MLRLLRRSLLFVATIVSLVLPLAAVAKRSPTPVAMEAPGRPVAGKFDSVPFLTTAVETTLASFNFDDPSSGGPDPQGWTSADMTAQIGLFFHVDNFAGMSPPYAPISGAQSLWCGARACPQPLMTDLCSYATLPGYGNGWDQTFESTHFSVSGDVTIEFDIRYDSEPSYDQTTLEYSTSPGTWQTLETFQGAGSAHVVQVVTDSNHAGSVRFRFHFVSDGGWSDEDGNYLTSGAVVVDNIVITDAGGVVDSQDFEAEPVSFLFSMDFDWYAWSKGQYGLHAGLFDGDTVLQEDPSVNPTNFWGFFYASNANYNCYGHPEQLVVPYGRLVDGEMTYLASEIRSPEIPFVGVAPGAPVKIVFDIYKDLALDKLVFFDVRVRSKVGGVWKRWRRDPYVRYGAEKEWLVYSETLTSLIEVGATSIQVGISARDMCGIWCGINGSGACHSHGPLIDNVRVIVSHDAFIVTNTNDAGGGSLREALTQLNASANGGVVRFEIPGSGPFVIPLASALPVITKKTVIDGRTQPDYSGTPLIEITAPGLPAVYPILDLSANESRVLGLTIHRLGPPSPGTPGIQINSNNNVVQGCVVIGCWDGIKINGSDNMVGGTNPGDGNVIGDAVGIGISVATAAQRNSILGNSIYDAGALGIDLGANDVTANDPGDVDTGANGLQNKPVLSSVTVGSYDTTIDGMLSSTPNTAFRVEFFYSNSCNAYGYGDGKTYFGFTNVFCWANGEGPISEYFAAPIPGGSVVTATATDPSGNTSEFSVCIASINTPSGAFVNVVPVDETTGTSPVSLVFDQVTGSGSTSLETGNSGPGLPGSFTPGNGIYYDLTTTATFSGDIQVCISYDDGALAVAEASLRLLHWDAPTATWVDITTTHDLLNNTICGTTDHFSPFVLAGTTATGVGGPALPQAFGLRQNVPNPFNPVTTIAYDVPGAGADVTIGIYDVSGRVVRTLVNEWRAAGTHQVTWDGRNASGEAVATGVYFYRMVAGSFVEAKRMVLLK